MTTTPLPTDRRRIFVTSDWHLGGDPDDLPNQLIGTQICRSAEQITEFIDWVGSESSEFSGVTEIVINGDMVDFLSPDSDFGVKEWIADEDEAIERLDRIIERSRGAAARGPFESLREFLAKPTTELTISIGNHDLELSLPRVRRHLAGVLGNSSRLRFVYDGEPIVRGRLLIEHGNRYDPWNVVDHSRLRQERSHIARGFSVDESDRDTKFFRPPAGTYLVVHGINSVLAKYPFINLIKPENEAAIPLLLTMEPKLRGILNIVLGLAPVTLWRLFRGRREDSSTPARPGNLTGARSVSNIGSIDAALNEMLGDDAELFPPPPQVVPMSGANVTNRITALWNKSREVYASIAERLNLSTLAAEAVDEQKFRQLEIAFQKLEGDRTFDPSRESAGYLDAAIAMLNTEKFDVVVFGHTHLPKKIEVAREGKSAGIYINAGTWAGVIRLPGKVCEASIDGRIARRGFLEDMATHKIYPYLFTCLGYAEVEITGETITSSELCSFTSADPRAASMTEYR